jgi:5-methylcytosine-specific restriction endonuclease McrA
VTNAGPHCNDCGALETHCCGAYIEDECCGQYELICCGQPRAIEGLPEPANWEIGGWGERTQIPPRFKLLLAYRYIPTGPPGATKLECAYCTRSTQLTWTRRWPYFGGFHIDHIIPVARGGTNHPDNLTLACPTCNLEKYTMTAEEFLRKARA